MTHLTSDELIDAMEADADHGNAAGVLAPERQAHLAACEECRRQLDDLAGVLNDAKQVSVPEPSPLFWTHFSERVRTAVDADAAPGGSWPAWLRWQALLPLGAVAMIILALMMSVPKQDPSVPDTDTASVEPITADDSWAMLADIVGEIDIDTAAATGVIEPGIAEQTVLELTADERLELSRLLQAELARAKS